MAPFNCYFIGNSLAEVLSHVTIMKTFYWTPHVTIPTSYDSCNVYIYIYIYSATNY